MNDSYDIPSEPRLSNTIQLSRPPPQSRTKIRQKKKLPSEANTVFLGLDDTVPLDGKLLSFNQSIFKSIDKTSYLCY